VFAVRFAALVGVAFAVCACESRPAFPGPAGPPVPVALDVHFAHWTLGTWALDNFDEELATQLAKYNVRVVDPKTRPRLVARVDLGLLGYRQAVDVYLVHDGVSDGAGRVRVPDLSPTTLDAAAPLVAAVVARAVLKDRGLVPGGPTPTPAPSASPGTSPSSPPSAGTGGTVSL
jgi:hypothetical protein